MLKDYTPMTVNEMEERRVRRAEMKFLRKHIIGQRIAGIVMIIIALLAINGAAGATALFLPLGIWMLLTRHWAFASPDFEEEYKEKYPKL